MTAPALSLLLAAAGWARPFPEIELTVSSTEIVTLAAVGDIRLDGPVGRLIAEGVHNPAENLSGALRADLVFGNLECALTKRGEKTPKTWNFRAPPERLRSLGRAGFNVLNIANNHVWDYGEVGFLDTVAALRRAGIPFIGGGKNLEQAESPRVFRAGGWRIGFVGFTSTFPQEAWARQAKPGVAYSDFARLGEAVARAKKVCDLLIVSFHGGTELAPEPNEIQKAFAHAAVDAGADLVLGHHPHVLQPLEIYRGKPVVHSLGNFLFVSPAPETRATVVLRAELSREGVRRLEFAAADTNWGRPKPASDELLAQARAALNAYGALDADPERYRLYKPAGD